MFRFILPLTILIGCSSSVVKKDHVSNEPVKLVLRPGETVKLIFHGKKIRGAKLLCNNKEMLFQQEEDRLISYISETYFSKMKPYSCHYGKKGQSREVAKVEIVSKKFPSERLNVDKKKIVLSKKDRARVAREWKFLKKVYANSSPKVLFEEQFKLPLNSFVTSIYGARRVYNNKKRTQHLGTDFRAKVGTPIHASNAGRVVVARHLFYAGGNVTIDHGLGIFTMYGHLSKIGVKEGDFVEKDTFLGLSGMTGRVTGPHLHWGVKVNNNFVEGSSLIDATGI